MNRRAFFKWIGGAAAAVGLGKGGAEAASEPVTADKDHVILTDKEVEALRSDIHTSGYVQTYGDGFGGSEITFTYNGQTFKGA